MRAAEILGRIMDVFETIESCSDETLEKARGLLVAELEEERVAGTRAPHRSRRRNAVFAAAAQCVHAASEHRGGGGYSVEENGSVFLRSTGTAPGARPAEAWQVLYRVHRLLDGVTTFQDQGPLARQPAVANVLAYMLRGPEPGTWRSDERDFARCVLEWMKCPGR
jgi:hypothetical protein